MATIPDFPALFAASPYPYLLIDTAFQIIGANPAYLHATGRAEGELVGKGIFEAFPANPSDPESTNLGEVRASIERAIATGKPHTCALLRYAVPRATPGGTVFDERYWSAVHTPVFDAAGKVAFVAQNAIDVTDLYRFDASTRKYYLKHEADAVPDVRHMNRPQMHEAMTRILSAERSQLQVLFDQAPGFIAVLTGREHSVEMVNQAYYDLVGHRQLIGQPVLQALPELAGQGFNELLDGVFASGQPIVMRDRKIRLERQRDGSLEDRYVDMLYQPILDQDGRVTGIFAQGNDVTGAYLARLALSEKVRQLEEIRSSQAVQLELADRIRELADPDEVRAAACALLGRKLDAVRVLYADIDEKRELAFIRRDWRPDASPGLAGQARGLADFGGEGLAALRAGQAVMRGEVLAVPLVRGSKLRVVLEIHTAQPRAWREDETRLVQELAERAWSAAGAVQAQAQLRTERDQSQYIFDSMAEGFAVLDRHWTILRMNAEGLRISQRDAAEVIGRNHWDIWPELMGTDTEVIYRRVMETGRTEIIELAHTLPDKTQAWIEIRTHRSLEGGIAFFFRDVTERRAVQEQMKLAERRKDEFLAMLAHELRNPLAPIGAAAQLLQVARLDEARVRQTSQIIGRQVEHMTHLINDLLDVSRVTGGLVALDNAPQDIRQVVTEAVEQVMPLIQSRRHRLDLRLSPEDMMVMGDKKRLVQVLSNILNNAAKYTGEGGSITLATRVDEARVHIDVSDNGIGMAPELAAHVFELFAQAERTSDRSAGGLGLGLALVKSLVELHGGSVTCHSEGVGSGSRFTLCLPRLAAAPGAGRKAEADAAAPGGRRALRILVVDDNVDAATMLAMLLEASGHRVAVEHDARAALARAQAEAPEVCLLDIGLPGMDGTELAQRLRALPATADALLVAVTGYGQDSDRERTLAAGFDHHLVKPLDMATLLALLESR